MINNIFLFKQKSQDFIVEERLPFKLMGSGDAFFVYFEKRNLNTMDVVDFLCKEFGFSRLTLGIAGLKDKRAITRQRISIYKSALAKIGGPVMFLKKLSQKVKVLEYDWHEKPIGMGTDITNVFYIRLRASKILSQQDKVDTDKYLKEFIGKGIPNFYGEQRFGIEGKNWKTGKSVLFDDLKMQDKKELVFKLQAYSSKLFNLYISSREKQGFRLLDGDILEFIENGKKRMGVYEKEGNRVQIIDLKLLDENKNKEYFSPKVTGQYLPYNRSNMVICGPVLGYNTLMGTHGSESYENDKGFFEFHKIGKKQLEIFKASKIFGFRRPLWVHLSDVNYRFQGDDLLLDFGLPSGSYASVFIDKILDNLVQKPTIKNKPNENNRGNFKRK